MLNFIKKNLFIVIIFFITLLLGFITFLTFLDKSFIKLNDQNLQYLLLSNIFLLIIFFLFIFLEVKNSIKSEIVVEGSRANRKYIAFFSLFTLIPSILISAFSLFLFSFAVEKYFDKKITTAVDNSYRIAQNYVIDVRNKIESDIVLVAFDLNKNIKIFQNNKKQFASFLNTQKIVRDVDGIFLVDSEGKLILSNFTKKNLYQPPSKEALKMVQNDDRPLKILNAYENTSAALMRLANYNDTFVYVVKFLDPKISKYLTESKDAISFYYTVQEKRTGIKISFAIIYMIVVTLLLFLSISIAIRFSSRFFVSINNLISASNNIGNGNLNSKVPEIKTDKELEKLNKNFNLMIDRLKTQQNKLLANERHDAWENVARKIAHEIKNPLTPIQLIIDSLKNKYTDLLDENNKISFNEKVKTINKQVKLIEKLVNEFSDFARMPKPIFKKINLKKIVNDCLKLMKVNDDTIIIDFKCDDGIFINADSEQISRVFINLIKNSIESLNEKYQNNNEFIKKIIIEIYQINDYIEILIIDNGTGFNTTNLSEISKPYFTTKKNGSGLGLSIVGKIINDHNGTIEFLNYKQGAKIKITFPKINVS
ncbi:ATP-binding protein [Candidatus Pelagibacter communis]|uniref:ATP-binding protein n=1 Tax=Pelagibacter ubique TaxID=198252 RepID=UPI00094C7A61|nr:ATP-binding protein [Candidatus Pelagibacter ubique]